MLSKKARRATVHVYAALPNNVLSFLVLSLLLISPFDLDLGEAVHYWHGMGHLPSGEVLRLGFPVSRQRTPTVGTSARLTCPESLCVSTSDK